MAQIIINSVIRTILAYLILLTLARIMGRKMISQMTFFDFIVSVMIGTIAANLALFIQNSPVSIVTTLVTLTLSTVLTGYLSIKSFKGRKLVNSEPLTLIEKGKIVEENMKRTRFTINNLTSLLREKNMFSMADVEFAFLETDGKLSVLPKAGKQPLTPADMNIPTTFKGLTKDVIIDGEVMDENLQDAGKNNKWLLNQLKSQGIERVEDVFYGGLDSLGSLYVSPKVKREEKHGKYGIE